MNVLVVDDSKYMRTVVKSYFDEMQMPCNYFEAQDGGAAMSVLQGPENIQLVFLDWNMPNMSGIEFLKKVRAIEKFKDLPIVMVTSEAARANVIEAHKSGVTDYILKPIDRDLFREKIAEIFDT
ncbi:MAG: response regulator [Spirochaetaceae bacterium]|jgi:two-component system chemotaxis response regulator CheY|nr:response regulator [Spirochaetaceae bacterium]